MNFLIAGFLETQLQVCKKKDITKDICPKGLSKLQFFALGNLQRGFCRMLTSSLVYKPDVQNNCSVCRHPAHESYPGKCGD